LCRSTKWTRQPEVKWTEGNSEIVPSASERNFQAGGIASDTLILLTSPQSSGQFMRSHFAPEVPFTMTIPLLESNGLASA
jgi:hypothetical protein